MSFLLGGQQLPLSADPHAEFEGVDPKWRSGWPKLIEGTCQIRVRPAGGAVTFRNAECRNARMLCGLTEIAVVSGGLAASLLLWDGLSHTFLQDDDRSIYQIIGSAV